MGLIILLNLLLKEVSIILIQLQTKLHQLESQIKDVKHELKSLPPGTLSCARNGNYYKWYQCSQNSDTYIPKSNRVFAQQLAYKKYLSTLLEDLSKEKRAIELYLKHYPEPSKVSSLLSHPEFQILLAPYFTPFAQEITDWMNSSYDSNPQHTEHLIHRSTSGNLVRSKSEAMIDMLLHVNKIPFRYECALSLGDTLLYPDFTIRHPKTGTFYYWEHFGLMDNPGYSHNTFSKLELYASHGIIPTINLITTYETKASPLDPEIVKNIISRYFL